jgi:hypothetical protein
MEDPQLPSLDSSPSLDFPVLFLASAGIFRIACAFVTTGITRKIFLHGKPLTADIAISISGSAQTVPARQSVGLNG